MAQEISSPQKNPGSFPRKLEADATLMECVPRVGNFGSILKSLLIIFEFQLPIKLCTMNCFHN